MQQVGSESVKAKHWTGSLISGVEVLFGKIMIFQQQVLSFFFALICEFKFWEEIKHEKQQWAISSVLHSYSTSTNSNIENSNQLKKLPLSESCKLSSPCVSFFLFFFFSNLLHLSASYTRIRQFQNWRRKYENRFYFSIFFLFVWY